MSRFASRFESIEKLDFRPVPGRPIAVVKAVRCDGSIAMLGADGRIYTPEVMEHCFYSTSTGRHADLFRCCKKLRVLSPEVIQQHIDIEAKRAVKQEKRWRASQILDAVKSLGLRFTAKQAATINAALEAK